MVLPLPWLISHIYLCNWDTSISLTNDSPKPISSSSSSSLKESTSGVLPLTSDQENFIGVSSFYSAMLHGNACHLPYTHVIITLHLRLIWQAVSATPQLDLKLGYRAYCVKAPELSQNKSVASLIPDSALTEQAKYESSLIVSVQWKHILQFNQWVCRCN